MSTIVECLAKHSAIVDMVFSDHGPCLDPCLIEITRMLRPWSCGA